MANLKQMALAALLVQATLLVFLPALTLAADPDPLQDFCVADLTSTVTVNGLVCKNAAAVNATDFVFQGLDKAGDTNNTFGSAVTPVFAAQLPGLNTQGIGLARFDFAVGGLIVPHTQPRASEIFTVLQGQVYSGFVSTSNVLYAATLSPGDVFVIPRGLVHFQLNVGNGPAVGLAAVNSQNPGVQFIAPTLFGATPPVSDEVLEKAFQIDKSTVDFIKSKFTS